MTKDLRKEHLALLRIEKQIAGLAVAVAAAGGAAKAADGKLHAMEGGQALTEIQMALVQLADVTSQAHQALNVKAIEAGARILQAAGGGLPKKDPMAVVASILGIG